MDAETQRVALTHRVVTFGYGQTDPVSGAELNDTYAVVESTNWNETIETMKRSVFGMAYSFDYDTEYDAGVGRFNIKKYADIRGDGSVVLFDGTVYPPKAEDDGEG